MSINEKNANTASEELINIPSNLQPEELIEIPTNLSNNTSSNSTTTYAGASSRAIGCGLLGQDGCSITNQCITAQSCNLCEMEGQGCTTTCEISCQNCEGDICEGCMTTCERACQNCEGECEGSCMTACERHCMNCEGVACQTTQTCTSGCEVTCEVTCEDTCETTCELSCQYECQDSCQNCEGVSCQTCQNCEGVSCQICQNCQVGCQNTCEKSCQNCEGACETYCENYCQTACEYCQTYCQLYCQNCEGVSCQTCQDSCQLSCQNGQDPCLISCQALGKWEWSSHVEQGYQLQLTADEWNQFTTRINYTRVCHGLEIASFTAAVKGQQMMASQANEAVNAIKAMNPSVATPSTVTSNSPITAQFINGLANSLNSL